MAAIEHGRERSRAFERRGARRDAEDQLRRVRQLLIRLDQRDACRLGAVLDQIGIGAVESVLVVAEDLLQTGSAQPFAQRAADLAITDQTETKLLFVAHLQIPFERVAIGPVRPSAASACRCRLTPTTRMRMAARVRNTATEIRAQEKLSVDCLITPMR